MRRPIKYQIIKLTITGAGNFAANAEADKTYGKISGVAVSTTDTPSLKDAVFSKFDIDSNEIYVDGYEAKMIVTGQEVPPDNRYAELDERADGSTIVINYTDAGNAGAYPYNLRIYLRLKNPMP